MARILVIDDDALVRTTISVILERAGHEIVLAPDGQVGVLEYGRSAFDLVITDILMPEQEGIETIVALRKANPDVKILAISGGGRAGNQDYLLIAEKFGANASLQKPFDPDDLVARVEALCR